MITGLFSWIRGRKVAQQSPEQARFVSARTKQVVMRLAKPVRVKPVAVPDRWERHLNGKMVPIYRERLVSRGKTYLHHR